MKRITVTEPDDPPIALADSYCVAVDWFPPLTEQQILENMVAHYTGKREPHPNPNLIEVVVKRSMARVAFLLRPDSD